MGKAHITGNEDYEDKTHGFGGGIHRKGER